MLLCSLDGQLYHVRTAPSSCSIHHSNKLNATYLNCKRSLSQRTNHLNYSFSTGNDKSGIRKRQKEKERSTEKNALNSQNPRLRNTGLQYSFVCIITCNYTLKLHKQLCRNYKFCFGQWNVGFAVLWYGITLSSYPSNWERKYAREWTLWETKCEGSTDTPNLRNSLIPRNFICMCLYIPWWCSCQGLNMQQAHKW